MPPAGAGRRWGLSIRDDGAEASMEARERERDVILPDAGALATGRANCGAQRRARESASTRRRGCLSGAATDENGQPGQDD